MMIFNGLSSCQRKGTVTTLSPLSISVSYKIVLLTSSKAYTVKGVGFSVVPYILKRRLLISEKSPPLMSRASTKMRGKNVSLSKVPCKLTLTDFPFAEYSPSVPVSMRGSYLELERIIVVSALVQSSSKIHSSLSSNSIFPPAIALASSSRKESKSDASVTSTRVLSNSSS